MKIGVVGTGNMGRSLGILWAEQGHSVFFGARDVGKAEAAARLAGHEAKHGTNDEAATYGEAVFYAARGIHPNEVLTDTHVLDGKIVIDSNNGSIPDDFAYEPITVSLAETLQAQVPNAHVVKTFNTVSQETFELAPEPLRDQQVSLFVAGDDEAARQTVMGLAEQIGFAPVDCGRLRNARLIEGLGDFIRFVMIGQERGPYTAISVHPLPQTQRAARLGGRQASKLN